MRSAFDDLTDCCTLSRRGQVLGCRFDRKSNTRLASSSAQPAVPEPLIGPEVPWLAVFLDHGLSRRSDTMPALVVRRPERGSLPT